MIYSECQNKQFEEEKTTLATVGRRENNNKKNNISILFPSTRVSAVVSEFVKQVLKKTMTTTL